MTERESFHIEPMNQKPILFNGEMIRAILDGRKTMTRRVIKYKLLNPKCFNGIWRETGCDDTVHFYLKNKYGNPGDFLWVKGTFYMPHHASRINLKITETRIERLQDITPNDCFAEGLPLGTVESDGIEPYKYDRCLIFQFSKLWDSINAKRGYGWEKNPWVWCISFKMGD